MRLCAVPCAPRTRGGLWTGACTGGKKSDGGVTATLKQGRRGSAADTAILRGCITLVQSLQHHPATVEAKKKKAATFGSEVPGKRAGRFGGKCPCFSSPCW